MEKLKKEYSKNGYLFSQVWRDENTAIYKQILPETGQAIAYEVFQIIKNPETMFKGKLYPERETTPSNSDWGTKGFTCHTIQEANNKLRILRDRGRNASHEIHCLPDLILKAV